MSKQSLMTQEEAIARHWGEKAQAENNPTCPYIRPDLFRAWTAGLETRLALADGRTWRRSWEVAPLGAA